MSFSGVDDYGHAFPAATPDPSLVQNVSLSVATAKNSTAFTKSWIRVVSDVDVFLRFGAQGTVTATTANGFKLPAGVVEYFNLNGNTGLAGILAAGTGSLNIVECS